MFFAFFFAFAFFIILYKYSIVYRNNKLILKHKYLYMHFYVTHYNTIISDEIICLEISPFLNNVTVRIYIFFNYYFYFTKCVILAAFFRWGVNSNTFSIRNLCIYIAEINRSQITLILAPDRNMDDEFVA